MQRVATVAGEPTAPMFHRFRSAAGEHLLIVPYSRVFDLSPELARSIDGGGSDRDALVARLAQPSPGEERSTTR